MTINTEDQKKMGVIPATNKTQVYEGPIEMIYLDKFGLGGDTKKLAFSHQAKEQWVMNILTGRGLKRKFTSKQLK